MERLYEKIDKLKQQLDETECIKTIKFLNKKVREDQDLLSLIEKYNYTKDEKLKEKIIKNKLFKKYKQQETELNLLILEINQELNKIAKKDKCSL